MRNLPEQSRIRIESFKDEEGNLSQVVDQANRMFDYIYKMLDGRLTLGEQVVSQFHSQNGFDPAQLPLSIGSKLLEPAKGVVIMKASTSGNQFVAIGAAVSVVWRQDGTDIRITELPGLTAGTKYDLTFLVV